MARLVLDEGDRLLDEGFEEDIKALHREGAAAAARNVGGTASSSAAPRELLLGWMPDLDQKCLQFPELRTHLDSACSLLGHIRQGLAMHAKQPCAAEVGSVEEARLALENLEMRRLERS